VSVKLPGSKNQNVLKEKFSMKNLEVLKSWENSQSKLEKEQVVHKKDARDNVSANQILQKVAYLERLVDKM
jgi:hypothetical protein